MAIMLDSAKRLENANRRLSASARSDVPAFMVMDVVAAAARLEAAGQRIIHMEIGQPGAAAPASAGAGGPGPPWARPVRFTPPPRQRPPPPRPWGPPPRPHAGS